MEKYIWVDPGTSCLSIFKEYTLPESSPNIKLLPLITGDELIAELNNIVPGLYVNSSLPVYLFKTYRLPLSEPKTTKLSLMAGVDCILPPTEWLHFIVPSLLSIQVKLPSSEPIKILLSWLSTVG